MKTIPLKQFLEKHDLHITVMKCERPVGGSYQLRLFESRFVAALRSKDGEGFHFEDGNVIDGEGDTRAEAFGSLVESLNHNALHVKGWLRSTRPNRFHPTVPGFTQTELLDGSELASKLV